MNEHTKTMDQKDGEYEDARKRGLLFAWIVYIGGVAVVTLLFISFVLLAFPPEAYVSKAIMTVGGVLVGASMIAFPYNLHTWIVEKTHRGVTIGLYAFELLIVALNTITAFVTLLARFGNTNVTAPSWVAFYEPLSVGAIVYTVAAWGVVFLLDPEHKRKAAARRNQIRLDQRLAKEEEEYLFNSIEGEDKIAQITEMNIAEKYDTSRFMTGKRHWGSGNTPALPATPPPALPATPSTPLTGGATSVEDIARMLKEQYPDFKAIPDDKLVEMVKAQLARANPTNHQ